MSDWSAWPLPVPEATGYGYQPDPSLVRTPFATSHPRQRRRNGAIKRTFSIEIYLQANDLAYATKFFETQGFRWFTIDLVSGNDSQQYSEHTVRLAEDYVVSVVGWEWYKLAMTLEQIIPEPGAS